MQNVSDLVAVWPTDADFGRDLGVAYQTVYSWKQRGSIPAAYWRDIIRAARRRGHPEITADLLTELHAREQGRERPMGFAEEEAAMDAPKDDTSKAVANREKPHSDGHFSRWKHLRRSHFASSEEVAAHIRALRDEWDRR